MEEFLSRFQSFYRGLPDKKRYIEFVSAILTVPVLTTVIISNLNNINKKQAEPTPTPAPVAVAPVVTERIIILPSNTPGNTSPQPTPTGEQCKKEIGPIDIASPQDGAEIRSDPVCLDIARSGSNYCGVSWSYRLNDGDWSPYTTKDICLYGLSAGAKTIELKVKSMVSDEERFFKRNFTVFREPSLTPTQVATSSASY